MVTRLQGRKIPGVREAPNKARTQKGIRISVGKAKIALTSGRLYPIKGTRRN